MSESSPAATASPPATADPQDPLPESNWKWRRIYVMASDAICAIGVLIIMLMLYRIAKVDLSGRQGVDTTLATITALYNLGWWLAILTLIDRVLYLIAPSAEQATKMMATVSAWKGGVSTSSQSRAVGPDGSVASSSTSAGPAATPPAPATPAIPATPAVPAVEDEHDLPDYARA